MSLSLQSVPVRKPDPKFYRTPTFLLEYRAIAAGVSHHRQEKLDIPQCYWQYLHCECGLGPRFAAFADKLFLSESGKSTQYRPSTHRRPRLPPLRFLKFLRFGSPVAACM